MDKIWISFLTVFLLCNNSKTCELLSETYSISPILCLTPFSQPLLHIPKPCTARRSDSQANQWPGATIYILPIENTASTLYILETQTMSFFFSPQPSLTQHCELFYNLNWISVTIFSPFCDDFNTFDLKFNASSIAKAFETLGTQLLLFIHICSTEIKKYSDFVSSST